jgi:hypothetical protein
MPAFRSVVSVLLRELGDFLYYTSRPPLRAAACGGRPRPAGPPPNTRRPPSPCTSSACPAEHCDWPLACRSRVWWPWRHNSGPRILTLSAPSRDRSHEPDPCTMAEVERMTRGHKGGPPRGPGHYSEDGRRWWDDDHRCWFPVTDQEDQLEIEVEDYAETSLFNRLWSGLFTQYGHPTYFRFVGRARSADPRWPTYQVVGATFPEPGLGNPSGKGHGPTSNEPAWKSCRSNCSGRDGGWSGGASIGGRCATSGRWWT